MRRLILEREQELAQLRAAAREALAGAGSVAFLVGEAGIGKSSMVGALRALLPDGNRLLVGYCDDLATPRVLGPLRDLVGSVGAALTEALHAGDRGAVVDALLAELDRPGTATVLVVEDAHWADEATLDVLRVLARRIAALPALLVVTYRAEELTREHPLRQLLGTASGTPRVRMLRLAHLSPRAVGQLGADTGLDTDEVFAITSGNPFLVVEVLAASRVGGVPPTVAAMVQARLQALDGPSRAALERVAVVPGTLERWLVEAVLPDGLASLVASEECGAVTVSPHRIAFRHELMRRAVVDSMPAAERVSAHGAVLAALLDAPGEVDPSRIVHHAAEAGADDVVLRHGPVAAREAARAGSHREAVGHYATVLPHRRELPPADRAELLEGYAVECYTLGLAEEAVAAQEEAVALRRTLGCRADLGGALRWLSRMYWWAGNRPQAEAVAAEAIAVLDGEGESRALAWALSNRSQLHMLADRGARAMADGERAVAMARRLGDAGCLSHALNNVGYARWAGGDPQGKALLEESLAVALRAGETDHACRAYVNLAWNLIEDLRLDEAEAVVDAGIELAQEAEFLGFGRYLRVTRGRLHLARARWDAAEREAEMAADVQPITRCPALLVIGRARTRRGQEGADDILAQAWDIAARLDEPQRVGPAAAALAEAAQLRGDPAGVVAVAAPVYERTRRFGSRGCAAELGYRLRAAGADVPVDASGHPYALLADGRWREAAQRWRRAGSPYEAAAALAHSPDPADLIEAVSRLDALGAAPLARQVRARLKELGAARIPRGPMPATRDNAAGLTARQVDVVRLLADGLTNAEIAARLVVSPRTVDAHVAAILAKLGSRTRRDAAVRAAELGLVGGR